MFSAVHPFVHTCAPGQRHFPTSLPLTLVQIQEVNCSSAYLSCSGISNRFELFTYCRRFQMRLLSAVV